MMKKLFFSITISLAVFGQALAQEQSNTRLIIKFKKEVNVGFNAESMLFESDAINRLNKDLGCVAVEEIGPISKAKEFTFYVIEFAEKQDIAKRIEDYLATNQLEYAEPDFILKAFGTPNDPFFNRSWSFLNTGQTFIPNSVAGVDVNMVDAWDLETGDSSVVLSTMDTGLKTDHPEFAGRLWVNKGEIPNNNVDDDGNGFIDDINGYNTAYGTSDVTDDQGHGTNVTGISAATGNNGIGYAGVDWFCKVLTVKCLDSNSSGLNSRITQAMYYSVDNGADVINMSLGGTGFSNAMNSGIAYCIQNDVLPVVAMGNANNAVVNYPAGYTGSMAVGSTDANDQRTAPFSWGGGSSYGQHISVCAPGNYIYGLHYKNNNNYNDYWSGTSQAAPLVSGLATLIIANYPWFRPADVQMLLENTADDQVGKPNEDTPGFDNFHGHGRVNAFQALNSIGIDEDILLAKLKTYPNPTSEQLSLTWNGTESVRIDLHDQLGRVLQTSELNPGYNSIDVSNLAPGMYFIRLDNKAVKKVLIAR